MTPHQLKREVIKYIAISLMLVGALLAILGWGDILGLWDLDSLT